MNCECTTGCRTLNVLLPDWEGGFSHLRTLRIGNDWNVDGDAPHVRVNIGPTCVWKSIQDVSTFLKTILSEREFSVVQFSWQPGACKSGKMNEPKPCAFAEIAPSRSSTLYRLMEEKRLETWFQPIFNFDTLEPWGFECLVRARDDDGKIISPAELLKWAETEHLTFMFDRVCRELHIASAARANLPANSAILVNFIPTAIYDPEFCLRTTEAAVKKANIEPGRIIFEAVESEDVTDRAHLVSILQYYRQAGFRVALDDVGSGYAGLGMLADIDPDLIKIDRSLITKAVESEMHRFVCRSLVELGRKTQKLVLAEGIEREIERELFRELGVNLVQGFLFAKPTPDPIKLLAESPVQL